MKPAALLSVLAASAALLFPCSARAADYQPTTLALGASAPDFRLPGVDGKDHALADYAGAKLLVIAFTCNHCPTAQYYEPRFKEFAALYKDRGVQFLAISPNDPHSVRLDELGWADLGDTFEEMKIRARDAQFNFPYLYDGDQHGVARAYGPVATPHLFVFDGQRKLRYVGAFDDSERPQQVKIQYVKDAVDALLAGKEPPVTRTKVVGCSVKWAGKSENVAEFMKKLAAEPVTINRATAEDLRALRKNDSGKFRLVTFWATWCAPCLAEFHEFVTIHRMYRHRDFELVTVSMNRPDEEKAVLDFLRKKEASSKNLLFGSADRAPLIDAFDPDWQGEAPYTVLISPEGKVVYKQSGSIDALALKRTILKELNARKPW